MSSTDEDSQSESEVSHEEDPMQEEGSLRESGTRSDSPILRRLLSQASTSSASEASFLPGAFEISETEGRNDSGEILLAEVVEANVPGIITAPEAVGASVPGIIPAAKAEEGNVSGPVPPADVTGSTASASVQAAEAFGGNLPEAVSAAETGSYFPEIGVDAAGNNVPETVSSNKVVGDNDSGAYSVEEAPTCGVPVDFPVADAKKDGIPESVPNEVNVTEALQSTLDNVHTDVPPTESKGDGKMSTTKDSVLEDQIEKDDAKVHEPSQCSEEISVSKTEPQAKSEVDKAPNEGNVSDLSIDTSVAKDLKGSRLSQGSENAILNSEPQKSAATAKVSSQVPEPTGEATETSELATSSSVSGQTSKPNEEAKQETGKIDSKEAERSAIKRPANGILMEDLKSDDPKTPQSPNRRSSRLQAFHRTHSESPSPKKERKTVRSIPLERDPSDDKLGVQTRERREGSASSNSEMQGSGDEDKTKRVSRISTLDNAAGVHPTESKGAGKMLTTGDNVLEEQIEKDDAKVHEPAQSSEEIGDPMQEAGSVKESETGSDSPLLRQLLSQASTSSASEASFLPGAGEISGTEGGNDSGEILLAEVVEANVPGIITAPAVVGGSVPGIIPAPKAEEGNVPGPVPPADVTCSNASASVPAAEAFGDNLPEAVSAAETESYFSEIGVDAVRNNVPETIPFNKVVGDNDAGADSVAVASSSDVPVDLPVAEAKNAGIPESVPNEVNVTEALQSTLDNVHAGVPPTESKGDGKMPTKKDSVIEEQTEKDDANVHEPGQSSEETSFSKTEPKAKAEVDQAPKESNVSELAIDTSVAKDLFSEIKNAEKPSGPPPEPTEETMEASELPKPAAAGSKYLAISEPEEMVDKFSEPKCDVAQTSERVEEAMEVTKPEKSVSTDEESGQTSELSKEAAQASVPDYVAEGSSQAYEPAEEKPDPKMSVTTAKESAQTEFSKKAVQTSELKSAAGKDCSQASEIPEKAITSEPAKTRSGSGQTFKPTGETKEISKPQKSAATAKESIQVPELAKEEAMETSESAASSSVSGQTSKPSEEAKQEAGKIDSKEAERSAIKRPAKGRREDLKSDDQQTPKSPNRRSSRLNALQRTHSESPSPKRERKFPLERFPSDDKSGVLTRSRRVGSASSNSEMEGSEDEVKAKRASRKDSKK